MTLIFNRTNTSISKAVACGVDLRGEDTWPQQEGTTCHTAHETITLLQSKLPDHVISQNGEINWLPKSGNLTPFDIFEAMQMQKFILITNSRPERQY